MENLTRRRGYIQPINLLVFIVFLGSGLIYAFSITRYNIPCDDINFPHAGSTFLKHGRFFVEFYAHPSGVFQSDVVAGRLYMLLYAVAQILFVRVLSFDNLYLVSYLVVGGCSVAALLFTYLVGKKLFNQKIGLLSAAILASSLRLFFSSHTFRPDVCLLAGIMGVFYYYLNMRDSPTIWKYVLLGFLSAGLIEIHLNAVYFIFTIGVLVLVDNYRVPTERIFIFVFAGVTLLMLAVLIFLRFLPDPEIALIQLRYHRELDGGNTLSFTWQDYWSDQVTFLYQVFISYMQRGVIPFTIYTVFAIGYWIWDRENSSRLLFMSIGVFFLAFYFGQPNKNPPYGLIWEAYGAILISSAVVHFASRLVSRFKCLEWERLTVILILPLLLVNLGAKTWLTVKYFPRNYRSYQTAILELVPPGVNLIGDPLFWFMVDGRNNFTSEFYLRVETFIRGNQAVVSQEEVADMFKTLSVEYVILDGGLACENVRSPLLDAYVAHVEDACILMGQVDNRWFGVNAVYGNSDPTRVFACSQE